MSLFQKLSTEATEPERATTKSAGYDITATSMEWNEAKTKITYGTGLKLGDIPDGYFAALFPRSSVSNTDLRLANSVGVVDADYTGEIKVIFDAPLSAAMVVSPGNLKVYQPGDRIAQILFLPVLIGDVVVPTEERDGGFGSTTDTKTKRVKK